jgi:hypothetical protein
MTPVVDLANPLDVSPLTYLLWLLIACTVIGLFLLIFVRGEVPTQLGVGLVTGAVFAAAAYLAQTNFEQRSYINSLTTAGDLPGFDDLGKNLNGATLAARNMRNAQLVDAKLEEANLADTSLNSADLIRAKLSGASLFHAKFVGADLTDANLTQANIRGAKFIEAGLGRTIFDGALADLETCWPLQVVGRDGDPAQVESASSALLQRLAQAALVPSGVDDQHNPMSKTIGHVCEADDADGAADEYRVRVCVDGTILTVPREGAEADKPVTCERPLE